MSKIMSGLPHLRQVDSMVLGDTKSRSRMPTDPSYFVSERGYDCFEYLCFELHGSMHGSVWILAHHAQVDAIISMCLSGLAVLRLTMSYGH